ncbi:MAG: cupredoxin family protein [Gammaproteobacteria bacterium]|nr:cupredoxin family protein [Gammaproteobacteria bacterium]MBU1409395.1 cupredoxin family protein [Gammaproteobacteria bacterium]MBU1531309.1 cupredoxin family protein [Gammaproteobacteria bacterium]
MKSTLLLAFFLAVPLAHAHGDKKHAPAAEAAAKQTAWGIAGKPAQATRTIALAMTDAMRFTPDTLAVQEGDTVRFVVRNTGRMLHEMVIGTPAELAKHAALMARFPNMEHDEAYMVHVEPGTTGEIVWHFNRAGSFELACLVAGHYEAGMRGTITVTPKQGAAK